MLFYGNGYCYMIFSMLIKYTFYEYEFYRDLYSLMKFLNGKFPIKFDEIRDYLSHKIHAYT
jgi:hypothetical protein